jgi:choline dehydrogenase-like flavoprotein
MFESWTQRNTYDGTKQFTPTAGLSARVQKEAGVGNARVHVYRTPDMNLDETPKVGLFMEQIPNPESRVVLSDTTDVLGMRRLRLDWRLTDFDWKSYEETTRLVAEEFVRIGVGSLVGPIKPSAPVQNSVLHSNHQLGTTRMSEDRKEGVVDPNCRVHDLDNLFIIGGSIMPTVSWANPTFTVLALTLRLANYLRAVVLAQ